MFHHIPHSYLMVLIVLNCGLAKMDTVLKVPDVSSNVTIMRGHPKENITFIWNYNYTEPIDIIIFNRKKNELTGHLGFVEHGIFNETVLRVKERVVFNKTGDLEGIIHLTLLNTTAEDYNWNYTCRIVFIDNKSSSSIGIFLFGGPNVFSNVTNMRGHPDDNITFIWNYNYTEPIHTIIFNRKNEQSEQIDHLGFWEYSTLNQTVSKTNDRVMLNRTGDLEGIIYLTLLNTTAADYNLNYTCRIAFNDKTSSSNMGIFLSGGPDVFSNVTHVCGRLNYNITFIWNYNYIKPIHTIIFNRKNEQNEKIDPVGFWEYGIFNQSDSRVKERVIFNKTGDLEGTIYLTLLNTTARDYNFTYTCRIDFNDNRSSSNMGIFLVGCPKMYSNETYMYGRHKENITFVWLYIYTEPIDKIIFNRTHGRNGKIDQIGYWQGGEFSPTIPNVKGRLKFNKTEGRITLTLLDASREDFNCSYICRIIFHDKQESNLSIWLEEKASLFVKDDSALSTWEIAGIVVGVVLLAGVLLLLVIVLVIRSELVRKIICCTEGNNTDQNNREEKDPLRKQNRGTEDKHEYELQWTKYTAVVM